VRKKVFVLVIVFSVLINVNLLVLAESSERRSSYFQSNGDLINGWYWLRDTALGHYAEWIFEDIPPGSEELILDITALATDRPGGGRGFDAKFKLIYGFPGNANMGGVLETKVVTLPNISSPDDPSGYTCHGQVTVDRAFISGATTILFRIERDSVWDNHIAFKKDSIVLFPAGMEEIEEEQLSEGNQLPETDTLEGAILIQPGIYIGSLGDKDQEGHRDNNDYYQINLKKGQLITLRLMVPGNANFNLSLLDSNRNSRGSSITQGNVESLGYVADSTGSWYIKVSRSSGEGEYQLLVDIQNQNDAASGQDAGSSYQEAIPISAGTFNGFLKAGDNEDYYSIGIVKGQLITLQLAIPGDASFNISLLDSNRNSRGSFVVQLNTKTLDYVADSTGIWYVKASRSSGEGWYQLLVNIQNQNDAASGQDAGSSYQEAIPISAGTFNGFLKAGDNEDYYSINLQKGQQINLKLTIPGNASFNISLLNPNRNSRGSSITQGNMKTLDYIADSTGTWYIKITRSSGEGEYQLSINAPDIHITQKPKLELSISNEGRGLISNLPIFVNESERGSEIDLDGDGILQEFEDQAMDFINPKFELDEDEDWLKHPEHHVVNFVRVFPYPDKENHKYVIFTYCITWSRDYGRTHLLGHDGDVERVIMAYEVISEGGKNLQLRYVFTSAHGGENDHSAVWDAWNRSCSTCGISLWPFDEEMCGQLVFENNILKLQISEDKHAIYPTKDCCEGVHLVHVKGVVFVMEDCVGGGTWRFNCYNAGEPDCYLIDDLDNPSSWKGLSEGKRTSLANLFPQEQVWSGNKSHPGKFCGGLTGEGSKSDLWEDSPDQIGNKLKSLPGSLTDKLR